MVKIIRISYMRSAACIELDDGQSCWLHQEDLLGTCIAEGAEFDHDQFWYLIRKIQYPRALNTAVSMLARRPCSKKEIKDRLLHRHYTHEVTERVLFKLEKEKCLDDLDFCKQWVSYRLSKKIGPEAVVRELRIKGIPEETIFSVMDSQDSGITRGNALHLAEKNWKRFRNGDDRRKYRQKVAASLVRKGYDWNTALEASEKAEKRILENSTE